MSKVQIIGVPQSTFVRTVRIAAEEKGVAYDLVPVPPHTPEVQAIHPFGKVPAMRHGDLALCESKAIATYFDRAFSGPRLIPEDAVAAARVEQWVSLMNTGFQFAIFPYLMGYIFPGTADGSPDRVRIDGALKAVEHTLSVIDRGVAKHGHLVGDSFTLADMAVLPTLYYLVGLPESGAMITARPALSAYIERHAERESVKATIPPPLSADDIAAATARRKKAGVAA